MNNRTLLQSAEAKAKALFLCLLKLATMGRKGYSHPCLSRLYFREKTIWGNGIDGQKEMGDANLSILQQSF